MLHIVWKINIREWCAKVTKCSDFSHLCSNSSRMFYLNSSHVIHLIWSTAWPLAFEKIYIIKMMPWMPWAEVVFLWLLHGTWGSCPGQSSTLQTQGGTSIIFTWHHCGTSVNVSTLQEQTRGKTAQSCLPFLWKFDCSFTVGLPKDLRTVTWLYMSAGEGIKSHPLKEQQCTS